METIKDLIYFDNNRTTKLDDEVLKFMQEVDSIGKMDASIALQLKTAALSKIANMLGCSVEQLVFTKSTSNGIQMGLNAAFRAQKKKGNHIIMSCCEHPAVFKTVDKLKEIGAEVSLLSIDKEGLIDLDELQACIKPTSILVSIMSANNETGVIQPIESIATICKNNNILFFSDASQYAGKMRCDVTELNYDLMAFSAHKNYGPNGVGILYASNPDLIDEVEGLADNTSEDLKNMLGMGKMADLCVANFWENNTHISKLKNYFEHQLLDLEGFRINGSTRYRLYNTSNVHFKDNRVLNLKHKYQFMDNSNRESYTLSAMGLSDIEVKQSFRFSFGKYNTLEQVQELVNDIKMLYEVTG